MLLCAALLCSMPAYAQNAPAAVTVTAVGQAALGSSAEAAESSALWNAKTNAVEQATGVFLRSDTIAQGYRTVHTHLQGLVQGFIQTWHEVPGSEQIQSLPPPLHGKILRLKIVAQVSLLSLAKSLSDMKDLLHDLQYPRIRVVVHPQNAEASRSVQAALSAWLQQQGYRVMTTPGMAEIGLSAVLRRQPVVHMGNGADSPYGIGREVAACKAWLKWQINLEASGQTILAGSAQATQFSYLGNRDAGMRAAEEAAAQMEQQANITPALLARWAQERYEGYTADLIVAGLPERLHHPLYAALSGWTGFAGIQDIEAKQGELTIRFRTRMALRRLQRKLKELRLPDGYQLMFKPPRGPILICRAAHSAAAHPLHSLFSNRRNTHHASHI